jgi:hypothetical protein
VRAIQAFAPDRGLFQAFVEVRALQSGNRISPTRRRSTRVHPCTPELKTGRIQITTYSSGKRHYFPAGCQHVRIVVSAELAKAYYPRVVCSYCGQGIPVTGKAAKLYDSWKLSGTDDRSKTRSFPLRCRACEEESVYSVDEIKEFQDRPKLDSKRFHPRS